MNHSSRRLAIACPALLLGGCAGLGGSPQAGFAAPPPPGPVLVAPPDTALIASGTLTRDAATANAFAVPQPGANRGSIFQAAQGYAGLVTGTRARSLGDMVTILLREDITTSKSAAGQTDREAGFSITPPSAGLFDFLNPNALNASGEGSFNGGGNAAQQSRLAGSVSVTIAAIYPNGTAEVVGEKQMKLSQGEEWVQFAGRIRLVDISGDNTLPSSRVANARIIYSGSGAVQQASRPGWLAKFFNLVSPF